MGVAYKAQDGCVRILGDNELQHWKYIKKIGNRYFYTQEALEAYYHDQQKVANAEYAIDKTKADIQRQQRDTKQAKEHKEHYNLVKKDKDLAIFDNSKQGWHKASEKERRDTLKSLRGDYKRRKRMNRFLDRTQDAYMATVRTAKPIIKTGKRAVTPVETPGERLTKAEKKIRRARRKYGI